ncbi:SDR family oxidoreductase [uncultured Aquitalea sp.]|uniref:SDR family oxidoreductase n=1 Tax=uncultured Aquitalea sp. TaxID=540272 RepID=UPI0025F75CC6|nr:SDR family oxidoreductase [uncultured Aquitalea sp.]
MSRAGLLRDCGLRADFSGRTVLVTGGAQGIGLGICRAFAAHGAQVAIADLQADKAEAAAEALRAAGARALALPADLASREQCLALPAQAAQLGGRLDILVHNAGYFPLRPLEELDEATLRRTLDVNLAALFWLTQAARPLLPRPGGRILATSSVTGPRVAYPGLSHYAASKAGVNGFIRAAALELASQGITVNGVEPGMIRTPAMGNLGDEALNAAIGRAVPLGRLGEPADIASAMVFLASDSAGYITGQTLIVDGGATLPETTLD